jgi:hypothetical protein
LAAIISDRNRPQKHVQRARIILHSDERLSVLEVAGRVGVSRPAVWRWQQRFAEEGIEGLLRDKSRPARHRSRPRPSPRFCRSPAPSRQARSRTGPGVRWPG